MVDYDAELATSEATILGVMLDAPQLIGQIISEVSESDFWHAEYSTIFRTIKAQFIENKPTDVVMICNILGKASRQILRQCIVLSVTTQTWRAHAEAMKAQTKIYKLQVLGQKMTVCKDLEEMQEYIAQTNDILSNRKDNRIVTIKEGLLDFWDRQSTEKEYLRWGIEALDKRLYSDKGDFIILGGRPSAGKTAFAINCADFMSRTKKVGFFSLETGDANIFDRFFTQSAGLKFSDVKNHKLDAIETAELLRLSGSLQSRNFDVIKAGGLSVQDISAISLARKYDVIFIDYVQLIASSGYNRVEQVAKISIALHTFAQKNGITVIALAQLSRPETGGDSEKAPTMASLKESGQLEQDADCIMLLYLSEPKNMRSDRILKVAKNKEGTIGSLKLTFDGAKQKFSYSSESAKTDKIEQMGFHEVTDKTPFSTEKGIK